MTSTSRTIKWAVFLKYNYKLYAKTNNYCNSTISDSVIGQKVVSKKIKIFKVKSGARAIIMADFDLTDRK